MLLPRVSITMWQLPILIKSGLKEQLENCDACDVSNLVKFASYWPPRILRNSWVSWIFERHCTQQFWVVKGSWSQVIETPHYVHWWKLETKPCFQMGKREVENSLLVTSKTKWEREIHHVIILHTSYPQ